MLSKIFHNGTRVWGHSKIEKHFSWWRHQMETFSALPALCEGIHRSPVDSPHKDQWRGILMFSFICAWTHDWANNQDVGDLKRRRAHYCIIVMWIQMVIHPHRKTCSLFDFGPILKISSKSVNTSWLWPGDAILCHRTWSALVQVMASSLMARSHYLKQYWLTILWFSFHDNVYLNTQYTNTQVSWNLHVWNLSKALFTCLVRNALTWTGFVTCLQMPWLLTPPEHQ